MFPRNISPKAAPPVPARAVLEAVRWILNTGAQWHLLLPCAPNSTTVHRRFQPWCARAVLREILTPLANTLRDAGALDERERVIDATFAAATGGGDAVGLTTRGTGVKTMAMWIAMGYPARSGRTRPHHHAVTLVQLRFDFSMLETAPEHLIGERADDGDGLDDDLKQNGVDLIAPHRCPPANSRPKTADICGATSVAGSSNGSLPDSNGSDNCWQDA